MNHLPWTRFLSTWFAILASCPSVHLFAQKSDKQAAAEPEIAAKDRAHWAFRKPVRPILPPTKAKAWQRTPVDAFILHRLEQAGIQPAMAAEKSTLLRRVTFDLTGLPPTAGELEQFLRDETPEAYARVVDRLLSSQHYGERWAQHWLDVARYAESNGYEADEERAHAWRYRDYVVRSFNQDKPYDRFLLEQVAGDQLAHGKPARQESELLVAAGFSRCGPVHLTSGNTDPDVNRNEVLTEMTDGLASTFLGMTFGCARCHDHKFDPVSQADYYRLQSFFIAAQPKEVNIALPEEATATETRVKELDQQITPLRKKIAEIDAPVQARLNAAKKAMLEPAYKEALAVEAAKRTPEQKKLVEHAGILTKVTWDEIIAALHGELRSHRTALREAIHRLEVLKPPPYPRAWTIADSEKIPPARILLRGDPKRKGPEVLPRFPRVLAKDENSKQAMSLDRIALARWLTDREQPLTARVFVNRLWQHHFGRGLVTTPNDFGVRGSPPSHPELLDWLAVEFMDHGWSVKYMHRLLVLSNTYRQSSQVVDSGAVAKKDPDNQLLWRMNRRRLDAEALRDNALAVAGSLNPAIGGRMVLVPLEPEVYDLIFTEGEPDGLWSVTPDAGQHRRRSIYLFAKRNVRLPMLEAFDRPDTLTSCPVRPVSTFAPQALIMLNGPFMQEQSKSLATRLLRDCRADLNRIVERAHVLCYARSAKPEELRLAKEFIDQQLSLVVERLRSRQLVGLPGNLPDDIDPAFARALCDYCLALLNRNEFLYVN